MGLTATEIGGIIRKHRKAQGMTGVTLGELSGISQSKISKIETGRRTSFEHTEIQKLLNILEVPRVISQQVLRSIDADTASDTPRFYDYTRLVGGLAYEKNASSIRLYDNSGIPALVQTLTYRKAYTLAYGIRPEKIAEDIKWITARQDAISAKPMQCEILIHEAALYTVFAPKKIHIAQLDRIERLIHSPLMRLGIVSTKAGLPLVDFGPFVIYDANRVYACIVGSEIEIASRDSIEAHGKVFEQLKQLAVYGEEAITIIREAMDYIS